VLVVAGLGTWFALIASDGYLARANVVFTVIAAALLAAGLALGRAVVIPAAVTVLGAQYTAIVVFDVEGLDTRAPLVACGLLAAAELAYWSLELSRPVVDEAGMRLRRLALLAALLLGTVMLGVALLALVAEITARGAAVNAIGAGAAVAALALLALAARRARPG
jgi:hypothetical protein